MGAPWAPLGPPWAPLGPLGTPWDPGDKLGCSRCGVPCRGKIIHEILDFPFFCVFLRSKKVAIQSPGPL